MRRIIVNTHVSNWRKDGRIKPDAEIEQHMPQTENPTVDDAMLVAQLLVGMPKKQSAVVVMRFLEDMPFSQIAEVCNVSESSARSQVHRALLAMRAAAKKGEK